MTRLMAIIVAAASLGLLLGGCSDKPRMGQYTVRVAIDEAWRSAGNVDSIQVDLVALNEQQAAMWQSYALSQYFSGGDLLRQDADKATFRFSAADTSSKELARSSDIWGRWRQVGAVQLFVLADLPEFRADDRPGESDRRRLILPLDRRYWKSQSIDLVVKRSGLELVTPMQPVQ